MKGSKIKTDIQLVSIATDTPMMAWESVWFIIDSWPCIHLKKVRSIRVLIAVRPCLVQEPDYQSRWCLLQFEVYSDQCSVLVLLTVTDTRYPTTAGKAT